MIAINASAQLAALAGVVVLQTAYSVLVARILGVEDFGRFAFVFSITQILLIGCDLGLHNTAIRKISADRENSSSLFSIFFHLKLAVSLSLVLAIGVLSLLLRETREVQIALFLFGLGMFFHSMNAVLNITFQAHGKLYLGSLNQFLISLLQFIIGVTLLGLGGRLISLGFAYWLAASIAFVLNWRVFQNRIHPVHLAVRQGWKEFLRESMAVGLGTLFNTVAARINVTMLTLLVGSYQTGIYSAAFRVYFVLTNIPLGIFSAVLPEMASLGKSRDRIRGLFRKSAALMVALSVPLAVALFFAAAPLVDLLYGEDYHSSADNLKILAWSLIPLFVGMAFSHVMLSQASLVGRLPLVTGIGMIINLVANWILIPELASRGVALATLVTEVILALLYAIAVWKFLYADSRDPSRSA